MSTLCRRHRGTVRPRAHRPGTPWPASPWPRDGRSPGWRVLARRHSRGGGDGPIVPWTIAGVPVPPSRDEGAPDAAIHERPGRGGMVLPRRACVVHRDRCLSRDGTIFKGIDRRLRAPNGYPGLREAPGSQPSACAILSRPTGSARSMVDSQPGRNRPGSPCSAVGGPGPCRSPPPRTRCTVLQPGPRRSPGPSYRRPSDWRMVPASVRQTQETFGLRERRARCPLGLPTKGVSSRIQDGIAVRPASRCET